MKTSTKTSNPLPLLERVLVVGNGGRENSLAWAIAKNENVKKVLVAPGNGGTEDHDSCYRLKVKGTGHQSLIEECMKNKIDLVVIGAEKPLSEGLADDMRKAGLIVFGPGADGALIEASKNWSKELMGKAKIPTARYWSATNQEEALKIVDELNQPLVVKADGLAAGKGVTVSKSIVETKQAIKDSFEGKFGIAGNTIVLEECIEGPEVSVFALCDGSEMIILPQAQDHKRLLEKDQGPNTGGMGAYAPAKVIDKKGIEQVKNSILKPVLEELIKRGINYRGVIYAGLMITNEGPKVIEFNCRFGDPECQALMPLMGNEFAEVLQSCALGCLSKAKKLSFSNLASACVVAASSGYPERPRQGDEIKIEFAKNELVEIFHAGTKKDDEGKLITAGGRVLSVVAQGNTFDEAFKIAYQGLANVSFEGINYRRDIGNQVRVANYPEG